MSSSFLKKEKRDAPPPTPVKRKRSTPPEFHEIKIGQLILNYFDDGVMVIRADTDDTIAMIYSHDIDKIIEFLAAYKTSCAK